jgi:hypothetical protein
MSQPSAPPQLLSAEAVRLIDGQYADRPHLRPILDAVLAALPLTVVIEAYGLPGRSFRAGPDAPHFRNVHLARAAPVRTGPA